MTCKGEVNYMKAAAINFFMLFILSILSLPSHPGSDSEYGDIIKNTPEYKKITTPRTGGDNDRYNHYYHYHDPFYHPMYAPASAHYRGSTRSGRSGLNGHINLGIAIGKSEFDYDDIEDGDASVFHFGFRPENSHLGYEVSLYDSGESEVTSLTDIEVEVETINFLLTINSSKNRESALNFFGQGGIYFADSTLSGPFDSVSENSNGFLLAAGIEIMLNRHFGLRAKACNLFDVEDFADDESVLFFSLGGQFVF